MKLDGYVRRIPIEQNYVVGLQDDWLIPEELGQKSRQFFWFGRSWYSFNPNSTPIVTDILEFEDSKDSVKSVDFNDYDPVIHIHTSTPTSDLTPS